MTLRLRLCGILLLAFAIVVPANARTVALALSGGGARGLAHVGLFQVLEEEGLEPDLIVGTSMGAVIGGLYAAGYSAAELRAMAVSTDWSDLLLDRPARRNLFLGRKETQARHILSLRFRGWAPEVPTALSGGQKASDMLFTLVHRAPYQPWPSFDDLRIPFRAVATDLVTGRPVVFSSGDLAEAMRATVSLPLVFAPYRLDTLLLVDGGVIENIPVEAARGQGADVVIGVDVSTGMEDYGATDMPWELADRVTTIMHLQRNAQSRALADVVIVPDLGTYHSTDFGAVTQLIEAGYRAAREKLPELRAAFARGDSLSPRSRAATFCSRRMLESLLTQAPAPLPPAKYRFIGAASVPDSTIASLPSGPDGLAKLDLLRRTYMDRGRVLAHATALWFDSSGALCSRWEEGRIRTLRVSGLMRYKPWTVLYEFPLEEGQTFDVRRARRGLTQIYGTDLFESVTLSAMPTDSGADLTLRVRERESPQLRLGAGYSLERKGRGFVEFLNDNLLDLGARLSLFGKYGELDEELRAAVTFDRPPLRLPLDRLLQTNLMMDMSAGWKRTEFNFYTPDHRDTAFYFFERTSADLWLGTAFRRWGEISSGMRYEGVRAGGVLDEPTAHVTYLGVRARVDTKDRYPFPTSGLSWLGRYEYALKSRQTGRAFNRTTALAEGYLPLHRRIVVHGRGEWAWNDRLLPLWARFPIGGENCLLGLHTAERYGSAKLCGLAEVRYDLISRWLADAYVSVLYTVGAVSGESEPLPLASDYQHGVGASLALSTFLGPMTFTVSELLRSPLGKEQTLLYLNLGHEF